MAAKKVKKGALKRKDPVEPTDGDAPASTAATKPPMKKRKKAAAASAAPADDKPAEKQQEKEQKEDENDEDEEEKMHKVNGETGKSSSSSSNTVPTPASADAGSKNNNNNNNNSNEKEQEEKQPVTFASLGVCEEICRACDLVGWKAPTQIQQESIPWALQGRDIIGLAETGSGKTAAFAIPIVQRLLDNPQRFYAVVLAPTRELCVQIGEQFEAIGSTINLQTAVIVGGLDMVTQAMALAKRPHVVVATPGRLVDHLENTKGFHLKTIKYLVMDEADRLLSMDFDEALDKLVQTLPADRNTFLFSATMTSKVSKLQRASLKKPVKVEVSTKHDTAKGLVQNYMFVPFKFKHTYFASVISHFQAYSIMVFTDTCLNSQKLSIFLRHLGFPSICLHGQMSQAQRLGALGGFKAKEKRILVCTDVASRGLDIPAVDLVINFDIPKNSKDYIHRVGRTARAGRSGRAITMVTQYDIELFQRIEHFLEKQLEEFKDLKDTVVKAGHERSLEAMRSTELELREEENQDAHLNKAAKRGGRKQFNKPGKKKQKRG